MKCGKKLPKNWKSRKFSGEGLKAWCNKCRASHVKELEEAMENFRNSERYIIWLEKCKAYCKSDYK